MKKTILITGVAGFIGFSVTKRLLKKNYKILGIDNLNNYYNRKLKKKRIEQLKSKNFRFLKLDLKNKNQINKILKNEKINLIIHFAAQPGVRYSVNEPHSYIENNVLVFSNILEFVKSKKIKLIYSSSSSVYGDTDKHPIYEHSKLNPKNIYAMTKKNNEEQAEIYSKSYGLSIIGLRFFTVFGELGRPDMFFFKMLNSAFNNKLLYLNNSGNHYRDFTYINDVVNILKRLVFLKLKKNFEVFNVCSSKPIFLKRFIQIVKKYIKNINIINVPPHPADVYKTHGSNKRLIKFIKKVKFTNLDIAVRNSIKSYKKYKIYRQKN